MIVDTIMTIFGTLYLLCTTTFTFFGLLAVIGCLIIHSNRLKQQNNKFVTNVVSCTSSPKDDHGRTCCRDDCVLSGNNPSPKGDDSVVAAAIPALAGNGKQQQIKFILKSNKAGVPQRGTAYSAGYDLKSVETCVIPAKSRKSIKTDIVVILPKNTCGRIASRSGLSFKNGIEVGAGVIDEDYRNEIMVNLYNHSNEDFCVEENQRIAQLIVHNVVYFDTLIENVNGNVYVDNTCIRSIRGLEGFGSTGTK